LGLLTGEKTILGLSFFHTTSRSRIGIYNSREAEFFWVSWFPAGVWPVWFGSKPKRSTELARWECTTLGNSWHRQTSATVCHVAHRSQQFWSKQTRDVLTTSGFSLSTEERSAKILSLKLRYKPQGKTKIRYLILEKCFHINIRANGKLGSVLCHSCPTYGKQQKNVETLSKNELPCIYGLAKKKVIQNESSHPPAPCYIFNASSCILSSHSSVCVCGVYLSLQKILSSLALGFLCVEVHNGIFHIHKYVLLF